MVVNENEPCDICERLFCTKGDYKDHLKLCIEKNRPVIRSNEEVFEAIKANINSQKRRFDIITIEDEWN